MKKFCVIGLVEHANKFDSPRITPTFSDSVDKNRNTLINVFGQICIAFESENGALAYGGIVMVDEFEKVEIQHIDAGGRYFLPKEGMSFFDMGISIDLMRGGRLDITCLGAYQVSEKGDMANWSIPGDTSIGIGGGMDLVYGAKRV